MNCPPKITNSVFTCFPVKIEGKLLALRMNQNHPKNEKKYNNLVLLHTCMP